MRIGFFPNMGKSNIMAVLKMAAHICKDEGIEVFLPDDLESDAPARVLKIPETHILSRPEIFKQIDIAFSFGGDGTIIHLARQIYPYNVPVCGIHLGELGFLNQIEVHQMQSHIKRIANGDYNIEKRGHLYAYIDRNNGNEEELVPIINEIVITRAEPAKMARINMSINNQHTQMYPSDGLIVSTPTGSTAYSLSAGGPILTPNLNAIALVPMFPHTLSSRPLVIDGDSKISIRFAEHNTSQLELGCDSQIALDFSPDDIVHIEKSPHKLRLLHLKNYNYYNVLSTKLGWLKNF